MMDALSPGMFSDDPAFAVTLVVVLLAGFIRGFSGFGGPSFMLVALTWIYTPLVVVGKILIIEMFASIYLFAKIRREIDWRKTAALTVPTMLTIPLGQWLLRVVDPDLMGRMISFTILLLSLAMLSGFRYRRVVPIFGIVTLGLVAGVIFGATYIALLVVVVILLGPGSKAESRTLMISWGFFIGIWYAAISIASGDTTFDDIVATLPATLAYLAGTWLGAKYFLKSKEERYRQFALVTLIFLSGFSLLK